VSAADLARLFPSPSITANLLSLLNEAGIDGFTLRSVVVSRHDVPILLLPLFETRFDLSLFVHGWIKRSLQTAGRIIPSVFHPRVLGVGLLEGGWSEVGVDADTDGDTLHAAWDLALSAVQTLAEELKSDVVVLYNFNQYGKLPGEVSRKFNQVQYRPCTRLTMDFSTMEEYLGRLSKGARKDVRRKMRVAGDVRAVRSCAITPFLDRIYTLYLKTVERSPMALGAHKRIFFEKICDMVPGAEYTLYFVGEELVAFNLVVIQQQAMLDIYFCMEYGLGRRYNLYVVSWLENVRTCVERKIPFYYAGQGTEKTKAHLGATLMPSFIYFKHRLPLFDSLLVKQPAAIRKILSRLRFWPRMDGHDQRN
jgi:hypothetical protein